MNSIEKKYLLQFCYVVLLYIAGMDVKTKAKELADRISIVFKETFL